MAESKETLSLEVATPVGLALRASCESVQAPSVHGEFGVLPNHIPLLAAVKSGLLRYRVEGKDEVVAIGPGFVEAEPDRVLLLTELFAKPGDVDVDDVKTELEAAEVALAKFTDAQEGPEHAELVRNVEWAHARLACKAEADK